MTSLLRADEKAEGRYGWISEHIQRLIDVASDKEFLQLPDPRLDVAIPSFTPDSTRLITLTNGTAPGIHIWDLRSIRQQLAALGLGSK